MSVELGSISGDVETEFAPAKINLSLHVKGRRPDGYHELESLVCFADVGDSLYHDKGGAFSLSVEQGKGIDQKILGPNLIETGFHKLSSHFDLSDFGQIHLVKRLPIAAGIGGGSSDAAAFLRLARRYLGSQAQGFHWDEFALQLGADVPVCLHATTQLMSGIGEVLTPQKTLPPLHAVLVNPNIALSTKDIFEGLNMPMGQGLDVARNNQISQSSAVDWHSLLTHTRNDLQPIACGLAPKVAALLTVLEEIETSYLARMSGSGATCFALFKNAEQATTASQQLQARFQNYWVKAVRLGD